MRRNMIGYAEGMWRAHGDVVRTVLGPPRLDREIWMLHHPDAAARVLSGSSWRAFAKQDPVYEEIGFWLGHGILTTEGEDWTRQKRFVQPVFTKSAVQGYAGLMADEVERVVDARTHAPDEVVDVGSWMQELALRVVVRALFGESADAVIPHVRRSFPVVSDTVVRRGVGILRLPTSVPTPRVLRGRAARADLFGVCDDIVATRRAMGDTDGTDLLTRLLAARDGDERLTDDEVRDQVLVFLLAGHETTSTALTFALHLLGRHQDVQDAVRAEVRDVLGDGSASAAATASLPLTTAVLQETMRLYPSAPFVSRLAVADDEVMGHPVRAGTTVVLCPWTIHRHPDFWDDPLTSTRRGSHRRPRRQRVGTATPGCRSAAARAAASASTSPSSRRSSRSPSCCATTASRRWPAPTTCRSTRSSRCSRPSRCSPTSTPCPDPPAINRWRGGAGVRHAGGERTASAVVPTP
jgi:cytochrome P450